MSKAVLVIDMPENCYECPMLNGSDECILQDEDTNAFYADDYDGLRKGCPLRELPEKKDTRKALSWEHKKYMGGWNACIDAITGIEE